MANFNKVLLMGNLTRDPELRHTNANLAVCKIGLAVNRQWTDRNSNERREETTFVDCTAFGRQAEVLSQYLRKGRPLFIEGRLNLSQWQDQEGNNRSKLEVIIENFQFLGAPDGGGGGGGGSGGGGQPAYSQAGSSGSGGGSHEPISEDDIPF